MSDKGGNLIIYDETINQNDVSAWKAFLSAQYQNGTPVTVIYQLSEPGTTTHAPEEITLPSRAATLLADAGTLSIIYSKDANLVIGDILSRLEALEGGA